MNTMAIWFATFAVHAGVLLGLAWILDRTLPSLRRAWRETVWRTALFGALLTASAQMLSPHAAAVARWTLTRSGPLAESVSLAPTAPRAGPAPVNDVRGAVPTLDLRAARAGGIVAARAATPVSATPPVAPAIPSQRAWTLPHAWAAWLLAAWLAGCLLALARVAGALFALQRELRHAVVVDDAALGDMLARLCARAGVSDVTLMSADLASPIAVSRRRIVVPTWALSALEREPLRAMLAHELGHVVRRDPAWKIATALVRALLWFLPPAALARHRLDALAELACDDFAAQHAGDARELAECLATCAEYHLYGSTPSLAAAMAAPRSALVFRIERLLEGTYVDTSASGAVARSLAMLALTASVFCLPAIGVEPASAQAAGAVPAPGAAAATSSAAAASGRAAAASGRAVAASAAATSASSASSAIANSAAPAAVAAPAAPAKASAREHSSVSIQSDDGGRESMTISLSDDTRKFSARVDGKIEFDDAETDVTAIPGGSATFDETRAGTRRRIDVIDHGGKLERRWYVDGSERPYDEDARAFMKRAVSDVVRSGSGEVRAKRLYKQGGAERVLAEIEQIPTGYVRRVYLTTLFGLGKLTPAQNARAIELCGALGSDYERRQALDALFATQALDAESQVAFLRQALRFDSDYERAELLVGVLPKLADTAAVHQAWLDAALLVKSDYEHRRTLQAMLARNGLDDEQIARVIASSTAMTSDYEHRELLVDAAQRLRNPDAAAAAYAASARGINSDYERREALLALLQSGRIGASGARAILDVAAELHSDYECREVLVALARVMPSDAGLLARYREVAGRLSEYERGEAERALVR